MQEVNDQEHRYDHEGHTQPGATNMVWSVGKLASGREVDKALSADSMHHFGNDKLGMKGRVISTSIEVTI
jgi:hypothetical protein